MSNEKETVTILKSVYEDLLDDQRMLTALESAGVDNWSGYEFALAMRDEVGE